mgnify:CR=1 FL=1
MLFSQATSVWPLLTTAVPKIVARLMREGTIIAVGGQSVGVYRQDLIRAGSPLMLLDDDLHVVLRLELSLILVLMLVLG